MDFGIHMCLTDESMDPRDFARAVEDHGFESLFVPEHTHIPAERTSPYPGGTQLPREYTRTLDPFIALTAAAGVTSRIRLGIAVCLLIERDPIVTAKEAATLDLLSDGRLLLGVGGGWNREEMRNHGTDPATRFALLEERIEALRNIWTRDEATFEGEHVRFERIWSWPKPRQRPHPPILVGGSGPAAIERVLAHGDGWLPHGRTPGLVERIAELHRRNDELGRSRLPVTIFAASDLDEDLERYAEAGVSRCILRYPSADAASVLPRLERHAKLAARYAGRT